MPLLILWVLLALTVLALFVWRKLVTRDEDDNLHVLDGGADQKTAAQIAVAQKLDVIDKWGKIFTVIALVFGLILGVAYVVQSWYQNSHLGV
jgi:ABC-type transport system involved in cytochrome c biogenesis permease subunit